jgi:hypothetical protein
MAIRQFLSALWKHWLALMSSAVFTFLSIYSSWTNRTNTWIVATSVALALTLFGYAAYKAWKEQYDRAEEERAKRSRPELTASFKMIMGDHPQWCLYLDNSSESPAVGIKVHDVSNGSRVLQFETLNPIRRGPSTWVRCWILENGIQQRDNVAALFLGEKIVGQNSATMRLKITYSSLESRDAQRAWELTVPFWFDTLQQKLCTGLQSLESI